MTVTTKPSNVFKIIGINLLIACIVLPAYLFLIIYGAKEYDFDVGIFSIIVMMVFAMIWGKILMWSIRKYGLSQQGKNPDYK